MWGSFVSTAKLTREVDLSRAKTAMQLVSAAYNQNVVIYDTVLCFFFIYQRMTRDGVEPNERIMVVLERAYKLPCKKPFIEVI